MKLFNFFRKKWSIRYFKYIKVKNDNNIRANDPIYLVPVQQDIGKLVKKLGLTEDDIVSSGYIKGEFELADGEALENKPIDWSFSTNWNEISKIPLRERNVPLNDGLLLNTRSNRNRLPAGRMKSDKILE